MSNSIPNRWRNYISQGSVIPHTRFLAFKVPLKDEISKKLAPSERFTPNDLINCNRNLKLIIDLTNTTRYYNSEIFQRNGIEYYKIFTKGHAVPNKSVVNRFHQVVDNFTRKNNNGIIGVHCTHGVNRTGYLICKYMIQQQGISPKHALKYFQKGRGHPIERGNYIEDLMTGSCSSQNSNSVEHNLLEQSSSKHNSSKQNSSEHNSSKQNSSKRKSNKKNSNKNTLTSNHSNSNQNFEFRNSNSKQKSNKKTSTNCDSNNRTFKKYNQNVHTNCHNYPQTYV